MGFQHLPEVELLTCRCVCYIEAFVEEFIYHSIVAHKMTWNTYNLRSDDFWFCNSYIETIV